MIQTDTFKLTCYNCGSTIGFIKSKEPIPSDNERMCVNQIVRNRPYYQLNFKIYCLNCLNKIDKIEEYTKKYENVRDIDTFENL